MKPGQIVRPLVAMGRDPSDCWRWLGAKRKSGYGVKEYLGKTMPAARWVWSQLFGPIPDGHVVVPTCGNPECVNPHHLRLHTPAEKTQASHSGLTPRDVAELRVLYDNGVPVARIAERYDVDPSTVCAIGTRRTWKNVPNLKGERAQAVRA